MIQKVTLVVVGMIGLIAGCVLGVSPQYFVRPVTAYAAKMPENPNIIYIGPEGKQYGNLTEEELTRHNITILRDWNSAKKRSLEQPLDALLTGTELLARMTEEDKAWLRLHLSNGVIIVGLGVDLNQFAQALGLETLRDPGESDVPLGPDEAFMVYGLILGQPEDVELMRANNWFAQSLRGEEVNFPQIQNLLVRSSGTSRAQLASTEGMDHFFKSLHLLIEGMYQTRSEYKQSVELPK